MNPSVNLPEILFGHALWLVNDPKGTRAILAGADLTGANLAGADLAGAILAGADLTGANLAEADLARADLAGADLAGANLAGAILAGADLAGANLAGALGLVIANDAPERLQAVAAAALAGGLEMGCWHTCDSAHCVSGWAIHQAGELGRLLEVAVGAEVAGLMLLGPDAHRHFYDENAEAAEWLRSVLEPTT